MNESVESAPSKPAAPPPGGFWERLKKHKVLQWSLAYLGAALALAHAQELLAHTYHWPEVVGQLLMGVLIVGFPVAIALAWYHGHKGMTRLSAGEMTVVSLLLVIGAGLLVALVRPSAERATTVTVTTNGPAIASRTSIAVLPFANLTGDASKDYLGDGMAEEVLNTLAKVPGFKVPARTSSFAYKGRNIDVRQIARDLGVGAILEGSVKSAGERIRVTAQLVSAQDGLRIWNDSYDRQFTDIFKLQDELAASIVQELRGTIAPSNPPQIVRAPPTQDIEAYQFYLQARSLPLSNVEGTIALLDQALARDPKFARALAMRAQRRAGAVAVAGSAPHELGSVEHDAEQALGIDPSLAEAQAALGTLQAIRGNWVKAEMSFRAALSAQPSEPSIHADFSLYVLQSTGRVLQAHEEALEAYRLAPADTRSVMRIANVSSALGLDEDAIRFANLEVILGVPEGLVRPLILAKAAAKSGRYAEAAVEAARVLPESIRTGDGADVMRVYYSALGDPTQVPVARRALEGLVRELDSAELATPVIRGFLIQAFTRLGALEQAYALANHSLDNYVREGWNGGVWAGLWGSEMRAFRQDSHFQAFITRLKLMDYWKQYGPPDDCELRGEAFTCR
jgi:TolB-like protein